MLSYYYLIRYVHIVVQSEFLMLRPTGGRTKQHVVIGFGELAAVAVD